MTRRLAFNPDAYWLIFKRCTAPLRVLKRCQCQLNFGRPLDCCTLDNEGSDESAILEEKKAPEEEKQKVKLKTRVSTELPNQSSLSETTGVIRLTGV